MSQVSKYIFTFLALLPLDSFPRQEEGGRSSIDKGGCGGPTQGNRVLSEEDFEQVVLIPAGVESLALDAHFQSGLVFQ